VDKLGSKLETMDKLESYIMEVKSAHTTDIARLEADIREV